MLGTGRLRAILLCVAVVAAVPATASPAGSAVCDTAPVVRAVTVTQGVGEYARLARDKEALVRVAVSRPACSSTSTTLVAASTSLTGRNTVPGGVAPVDPLRPTFTVAAPHSPTADVAVPGWTTTLPSPDSSAAQAWPLFVVPAAALAPTVPGDFTLQVSVTLAFKVGTGPVTTRTYNTVASKPVTPVNALSVLLVPMGNAANPGGMEAEFTSRDEQTVQNGMKALSRVTPTAAGEGDLCGIVTPPGGTCVADTAAGLRWHVNPAMLNLGPSTPTDPGLDLIPPGQKFCGTGLEGNMPRVGAALLGTLSSWNARNPAGRADVVVGVVGEQASYGAGNPPPPGLFCDEGRAVLNGPVAWVRAVGARPASGGRPAVPESAGALLAQEFGHNLGLVPFTRDDSFDASHSPPDHAGTTVASADLGTGSAYNTTLRAWLADDRSAMKYVNLNWHNDNVLYQPKDWSWALCSLGGTVDPSNPSEEQCTTPGGIGGVAAGSGPHLRVSGRTDGTAAGTVVTESERRQGGTKGGDPTSEYRFVQLVRRDGVLSDRYEQGFAVHDEDAHGHDGDDGGAACAGACGVFDFVLEDLGAAEAGSTRVYRLEKAGVVLAEWEDTAFDPVVGSVELAPEAAGAPAKVTDTAAADEGNAYLSPDGQVLAWSETAAGGTCPTVKVAVLDADGTVAAVADLASAPGPTRPQCPSLPSIRPDNGALAVTDRGSLWTVEMAVDPAAPSISFGRSRRIFTCDLAGGPFCARVDDPVGLRGRVSHTAWERVAGQPPAEMALAFELNAGEGLGDVYLTHPEALADGEQVDATNSVPVRLGTAYHGEPSFSPDDAQLALRQGADEVWTVPVTGLVPALEAGRLVCECGTVPWWGTPRHIAVVRDGALYALDLASTPGNTGVPLGAGTTDSRPAFTAGTGGMASWRLYFDRADSGSRDVYRLAFRRSQIVRVTGRDCDNRTDVRAGIYVDTGNALLPLAVADHPTLDAVDPCGVHFETRFEPSFLTPSASTLGPVLKVAANLNDGVDISGVARGGDAEGRANPPIVSIAAPSSSLGAVPAGARVPLGATALSPTWGKLDGAAVQWFLRPPGAVEYGPAPVATGTSGDIGPLATPGRWHLKAVARDPDGNVASAEVPLPVCGTGTAVDFDPNTLFVPSEGNPVQLTVSLPCGADASAFSLETGSVALVDVGGFAYSQAALAWNVTDANVATAKFDRGTLSRFMVAKGLVGRYVPVTLRACSVATCKSGLVASGRDPTAPFTQPG